MKREVSAGGIIYKQIGKSFRILLLKDSKGEWTFPKGLVEKGEEKIATAKREISEEVGLTSITYVNEIDRVSYFYKWQGELVAKTVYYYLFKFTGVEKPIPQKEEGIQEITWFAPERALELVGYKNTNQKILTSAIEKIENL